MRLLLCRGWLLLTLPCAAQPASFELVDGDRVAFIGDGFFEAAADDGQIELLLATRWPERRVVFRNLGWSGDTVLGTSRDHYTNPPTAFEHLIAQINAVAPTVAFVGYGAELAYDAEASPEAFEEGLEALLDSLAALPARVVVLSPPPHEPERSPVPDPAAANERLARAAALLETVADRRGAAFVDLYTALIEPAQRSDIAITTNGLHLNENGYRLAAGAIAKALALPRRAPAIAVDIPEQMLETGFGEATPIDLTPEAVRFSYRASALPAGEEVDLPTTLVVHGLRRGRYTLYINDRKVAVASAEAWSAGVEFQNEHELGQVRHLQSVLALKNDLYFQHYRPQNETYLVGFRQYEQGQNARELALLSPLVGERDNEIGRLRRPELYTFRLVAEP
jgi:lysophospholipase L1-like esterase